MRALIVSADRFEDSELSEPLQQLQAKGVEVDIAAPQQGPITGKHGLKVSADLALSGCAGRRLRPAAVAWRRSAGKPAE